MINVNEAREKSNSNVDWDLRKKAEKAIDERIEEAIKKGRHRAVWDKPFCLYRQEQGDDIWREIKNKYERAGYKIYCPNNEYSCGVLQRTTYIWW